MLVVLTHGGFARAPIEERKVRSGAETDNNIIVLHFSFQREKVSVSLQSYTYCPFYSLERKNSRSSELTVWACS